jgi:4-amino-4-deoxy-L-arabinose transferase-like glycosyltransferase
MNTDEPAVQEADAEEGATDVEPAASGERQPSWWHRDHPTFAALSGFFTGLLFVALVPAAFFGVLSLAFDNDRAEDLFPFVLVTLVVPIGLVASQRTRRFGTYFWIGMLLTAIVVVGVGALVLWYLVEHQN